MLSVLLVTTYGSSNLDAAEVEWNIYKTLNLDEAPIDIAISPDGSRIFVLTDKGNILIYSSAATIEDKIEVGKHVEKIKVAPKGDVLILNSREAKTVQIITLDFIQNIDVAGAPFKGPADAPVVVSVFSDFQ
jgi:hypothetical protein